MKKQYLIKIIKQGGALETPKQWKSYGEGLGSEVFPVFMDTSISDFSQEEKYFETEEEAVNALMKLEEKFVSDPVPLKQHNFSWKDKYVVIPVYKIEID